MIESDPTTAARQGEILAQMHARIVAAIDWACSAYAETTADAGGSEPPPREFFASCVMQLGYSLQCGANAETFQGGDARMAWHAITNAVNISNHYWGSAFELRRD